MARSVNPKHFRMIKEFILFLERHNSQLGYVITNKGSFSSSCINQDVVPRPGEQTILDIKFCLERISDSDLDTEIEHFLRKTEDEIQLN